MKFNLQRFGKSGGGSTQTYEPSDEQKALWNLQIESAKDRQPNERYMNRQGRRFMSKVIEMLGAHGTYGDLDNEHNYLKMSNLAIDQVNQSMRKLVRLADWNEEHEVDENGNLKRDSKGNLIQAAWQKETLVEGRNMEAARDLREALRGTGKVLSTLKGSDGNTITIKDNGYSGELGGYIATAHADLDKGTTYLYEFVAGGGSFGDGLNKPVGDLVTVAGGAVTTANYDIDDYDGKYDSAATIASGSVSTAQKKNDSLVSGLNTVVGGYNTLQSGKANNTESLLGGLNDSNDSAVTKAEKVLQPLITDTGNAATIANSNLDTIQGKGATALTTANNNLTSRSAESQVIVNATNNTLKSVYADYDPSRQTASTILSGYRGLIDSETPATNGNLDTLSADVVNAYTLANNNLAVHISGDVIDTATANNALINSRPNYNLAGQSLAVGLSGINDDFDTQRQTTSTLLGGYRTDSKTITNDYNLATSTRINTNLTEVNATNAKLGAYGASIASLVGGANTITGTRISVNNANLAIYKADVDGLITTANGNTTLANGVFDDRIKLNDDNVDEIYQYSKNAANDAKDTASTNNADLSEYIRTNKGGLSDSKADLADLKDGVLPENYLQNMEDAIRRAMENTIGKTINTLGNRGVLNSSVTTMAINDIEKNAAEELSQMYLNNIKTVQSLSNDQFDHVITTDHENAEMTRQKNDISQDALDRAFKYRQTGYEDLLNNSRFNAELEDKQYQRLQADVEREITAANQYYQNSSTNSDRNAELEQRQYQRSLDSINRNAELTQQQYTNSASTSDRNAGLEQNKLAASQANINQSFQLAQQDFNNAQAYANLASQNINAVYSGKMQSAQATDGSVQQQLGNSQARHNFGAQGTQNQYGNTMQGIGQRYGITNQQLSNIQANVTEGSRIAQQDFDNKVQVGQNQERNITQQNANSVADVAQRADWGQQQHTNSYNQNQFDAGLVQNQFNNTQTGIQNAATFAQNIYGNTTNANQINANNINSSYSTQSDAIGSNWGRSQAGFNAGYQNNLQAINNAQTHWSNTVNGYNSEIGLHNNIFSNSLQGVNTKSSLYGQQFNQYSSMVNTVGQVANTRANIALNTFSQYGQWALDVYRGKMQANAADTAIYQQAISQAGLPIQFAGAAQEGAMYLPTSMWNASIGLNAPTLGAMNGLAGTGKTVVTQNGDSFWSSFGAGVAGVGVQRLVGSLTV